MRANELRNLSLEDLEGELAEQYRAYFNLRFREAAGEDPDICDEQWQMSFDQCFQDRCQAPPPSQLTHAAIVMYSTSLTAPEGIAR